MLARCSALLPADELFVRAFPLTRERVSVGTVDYVEDPNSPEWRDFEPPYDGYRHSRHTIHKLMRLACEDGQAWLRRPSSVSGSGWRHRRHSRWFWRRRPASGQC
jgi:hypothetical protein